MASNLEVKEVTLGWGQFQETTLYQVQPGTTLRYPATKIVSPPKISPIFYPINKFFPSGSDWVQIVLFRRSDFSPTIRGRRRNLRGAHTGSFHGRTPTQGMRKILGRSE